MSIPLGAIISLVVLVAFACWGIVLRLGPKPTETPSQRSSMTDGETIRGERSGGGRLAD